MIVGHGDLASALTDRSDLIYFASGVSNSNETRESEYQREISLLYQQYKPGNPQHLVYFSSLCVFYSDSRYARHKRTVENIVRGIFNPYTIVRIGNITWGNNPHTLINFIRNQIRNGEMPNIQDVYRYIVDLDEFRYWINQIPPWSCEMNITGRRMKAREIVKEYCYPWGKQGGLTKRDNSESELQTCI
jgi:hypothetical protein